MFIVYLQERRGRARGADAARAADGSGSDVTAARARQRPLFGQLPIAAAASAHALRPQPLRRRRRPIRSRAAPAASGGVRRGGATIQADAANNALIIMAPEPRLQQPARDHRAARRAPRAGVRRSADRRSDVGQGRRSSASSGRCCRAAHNRSSVQGFGGTNFGARGSGNNIIDASLNLGSAGPGPQSRRHQRHRSRSRASA